MVKVCPATVIVPVRAAPVLGATLYDTVPAPPSPPLVAVIHESLLVADQLHPAGAVTPKVPLPPVTATAWLPGLMEKLQLTPACVTLTVWPATVTAAVRAAGVPLAVAV